MNMVLLAMPLGIFNLYKEIVLVILLCVGAIQGLVYGVILWSRKNLNTTANRFLAAILFFFSYRLFVEVLRLFGIGFYDVWYHLFLEYNWIYGALIYFFVKAYVTPSFKIKLKRDWIHFLPVAIEFIWSNFIKSQNFFWDGTRESLTWLGYWGYVVWMHYPTMYVICGLLIIYYCMRSKKLLLLNTNVIVVEKTHWIRRILTVLMSYSIVLIATVMIDLLFFNYAFEKFYNYPLFIGMALITYWLGIEGFNRKNELVVKSKITLSEKEERQLETIGKNLQQLMVADKLYRDPELTLAKLSETLQVKSYLLTRCLNLHFGKKFSDYINGLRIDDLKALLKDPKNQKYTLLSLAFEVGFNSKASFNRAVKKATGASPSSLKVKA